MHSNGGGRVLLLVRRREVLDVGTHELALFATAVDRRSMPCSVADPVERGHRLRLSFSKVCKKPARCPHVARALQAQRLHMLEVIALAFIARADAQPVGWPGSLGATQVFLSAGRDVVDRICACVGSRQATIVR